MNQTEEENNVDEGVIFDYKRYALHDGPGIRTTVFLKGCPLQCRWCQNPESWDPRPEHGLRASRCTGCRQCLEACTRGAITMSAGRPVTDPAQCTRCGNCTDACLAEAREIIGRKVRVSEVIAEIEKDVIFYDQSGGGVTFSGGEPLMQPAFLHRLLLECADREIRTVVDTTCHAPPDVLDSISENVDLFLCDLKHMDDDEHQRLTGIGHGLILDNIRRLAMAGKNVALRMPVVPGFNDDERNIDATARFVASLEGVSAIDLLPYNSGGRDKAIRMAGGHDLLDVSAPSDGHMKAIAETFEDFGITVRIGG